MNLLKTLAAISGLTLLSRITGLVRDVLITSLFGANAYTDAYNIAFRIPNLLRRLFAEGAFAQAFVPILAEYKAQNGSAATRDLIDHVATALSWTLFLTAAAGVIGAPAILYLAAHGWVDRPGVFNATVLMTRIMFPYIGFMSLVALSGGILNTWREFRVPAFTPVLFNLCMIAGAVLLAPHLEQPIYALAWSVLLGGMLQLAMQVPALMRIGMLPRLSWNLRAALADAGVRRILRNMAPAVLAVSASQISILINTSIASTLPEGSPTWLAAADRLMEFPTALLGVALGTILLPGLARANADQDHQEYSALLDWGLRLTLLLAAPAAVALLVLPEALTSTLFHHDKFDAHAVQMTAQALFAYGIGLIGLILVKILAPGYYARQDIRTPVKIAVSVMLCTQGLNLLCVPLWAHAGLALSVGLGACINAAFLYAGLCRQGVYRPAPGWSGFLVRLTVALLVMAGVGYGVARQVHWLAMRTTPVLRALDLAAVIGVCVLAYFGSLWLLGFRARHFRKHSKA